MGSTLLWIYLTCSSEEAEEEIEDLPGVKMSYIHSRYVTLITKPKPETVNVLYGLNNCGILRQGFAVKGRLYTVLSALGLL